MQNIIRAGTAGLVIGIACAGYLGVGAGPYGSVLFCIALFLICEYGLHLFTGKCGYLPIGKDSCPKSLLRILFFNIMGTILMAAICALAFAPSKTNSLLYISKMAQSPIQAFARSVPCGMLMFVAVECYKKKTDVLSRYLGIFFAVPVFIGAGFEHSIANSFYLAYYSLQNGIFEWKAPLFILITALGNLIGAVFFYYLLFSISSKKRNGC